jgi:hypothetical protein
VRAWNEGYSIAVAPFQIDVGGRYPRHRCRRSAYLVAPVFCPASEVFLGSLVREEPACFITRNASSRAARWLCRYRPRPRTGRRVRRLGSRRKRGTAGEHARTVKRGMTTEPRSIFKRMAPRRAWSLAFGTLRRSSPPVARCPQSNVSSEIAAAGETA